MVRRGRTSLVVTLICLVPATAGAAAGTGTVEGEVVAPPTVEGPPPRYVGFIEKPIVNPITPLRPFDPRPEVFVFLEGPAAEGADAPPKDPVVWALGNHSFAPPLLPVVSGSVVEISNQGKETHLLVAPEASGLLPKELIGPGSSRQITVKGAGAIRIVSSDVPHLEARVVPVATRYFSRVNRDGSFKIENVPHGDWTLRIWYRDGWLAKTMTVTVGNKTPKQKVDLPEQLEPKAPAPPAPAPETPK